MLFQFGNVEKLLETVGLVCGSVNPSLRVTGIVLCMHEGQTTLAREVVADIEAFFAESDDGAVPWGGCRVLQPPIRRNVKLAEAPSFGQTIFDYSRWCAGANDYRKLAEHLLAVLALALGLDGVVAHHITPAPLPVADHHFLDLEVLSDVLITSPTADHLPVDLPTRVHRHAHDVAPSAPGELRQVRLRDHPL